MDPHPENSIDTATSVLTLMASMDRSLYKDVTTLRGLKYHYYYSPAQDGKHTLLFCHGFPSTSNDWRGIVPYFQKEGYGLIVPDMLGYGGTDKPADPALYVQSAMSQDLICILDAEKVAKVIAIGHDWYVAKEPRRAVRTFDVIALGRGTGAISRLANWYPERVSAYAFFASTYSPPRSKNFDYDALLVRLQQKHGYEIFGYWAFFNRDDADQVIQDHVYTIILSLH